MAQIAGTRRLDAQPAAPLLALGAATAWAPAAAFAVSLALLAWMLKGGAAHLALDRPGERSLHSTPTPRTGGLAIVAGIGLAWSVFGLAAPVALWIALALLVAVSFLDDLRGAPIPLRFGSHFVAAGLALWSMSDGLGIALWAPVILATAWMTNLYNFMDGSDGLAGGMALIGFAAYGAGAALAGDSGFAALNLSVAASALAFLLFNFHPARIFMGDAGSIPLGFLAAVLGVLGWQRGLWPAWFPVLVFSPFIVDATITLLRRLARGERVWRAHREHYYQRLVQMGWGHRGTALAEYGVMLAAAASALWGAKQAPGWQAALAAAWLVAYLAIAAGIDRGWKRFAAQGGGSR